MSDEQIREALERAEKATPGPWEIGHPGKMGGISVDLMIGDCKTFRWIAPPFESEDDDEPEAIPEDWAFLASARTDVPALAHECLARGEEIGRLRAYIQKECDECRSLCKDVKQQPACEWTPPGTCSTQAALAAGRKG